MTNDEYELFKAQCTVELLPTDQKLTKIRLKKLNTANDVVAYQEVLKEELKLLEEKSKIIEGQTKKLMKLIK